jgi:hypothetical protein
MQLTIAVISILVAVYRAMPRERQLDLALKMRILDLCVATLGFFVILYLEFYDFLEFHHLAFRKISWPHGIEPRGITPLILMVTVLWLVIRINSSHLSSSKIFKFQELGGELLWDENYAELLALLERNAVRLFKIANSDSRLAKLRRRYSSPPINFEEILRAFDKDKDDLPVPAHKYKEKRFRARLRRLAGFFVGILPTYEDKSHAAYEFIRTILLSPDLVDAMAKTRPYFALQLIPLWKGHGVFDFLDLYVRALLKNPRSIFYAELRDNQNISTRYHLRESSRFLQFFLADTKVAYDFRIYKSIGDYALSHLDEVARDHERDPYNKDVGDYREHEQWQSPLFAGVRFFDIMVREALFQDVPSHMWLYYLPLFMEKIVRNYKVVDPLADPDSEWPIRYSYIIYEMISSLRDWIEAINELSPEHRNSVLGSKYPNHENNNIVKSSIIALGECSWFILNANELGDKFQDYLMDIIFQLYFELRKSTRSRPYADVLALALNYGGSFAHRNAHIYHDELLRTFTSNRTEYLIKNDSEALADLEKVLFKRVL